MRLVWVLLKALAAALIATVCAVIPLRDLAPGWFMPVQVPFVMFALTCYLGKLMYDTLFFDHFRP